MDGFYLRNTALYQKLVDAVDPSLSKPHFSRQIAGPEQDGTEKPSTFNPTQDMVVSARIRPMLEEDVAAGFPCATYPRPQSSSVVDLHDLYNHPRGRPVLKSFKYEVDKIFDTTMTTEQIFSDMVADLIPFALAGGIGTLFAYGQTGSGKTYTVSHLQNLVVPSLLSECHSRDIAISMTIIELAGNSVFDLIASRSPIKILEDASGESQLHKATEPTISDVDQALDIIERAASLRRTASTFKNDASSRSHGICRIRIHPKTAASPIDDGLLYLVDLAGSEAARDIATHGAERMRETREINVSLSVLKDCIRGKAEADALRLSDSASAKWKKVRVPYRQCALTKILKHVFDPEGRKGCKTVVVACVNPSLADVGPSKNTLRYAEMLRG